MTLEFNKVKIQNDTEFVDLDVNACAVSFRNF